MTDNAAPNCGCHVCKDEDALKAEEKLWTKENAGIVVEALIKWLEDDGEYGGKRKSCATALKWLLFHMGKQAGAAQEPNAAPLTDAELAELSRSNPVLPRYAVQERLSRMLDAYKAVIVDNERLRANRIDHIVALEKEVMDAMERERRYRKALQEIAKETGTPYARIASEALAET